MNPAPPVMRMCMRCDGASEWPRTVRRRLLGTKKQHTFCTHTNHDGDNDARVFRNDHRVVLSFNAFFDRIVCALNATFISGEIDRELGAAHALLFEMTLEH